VAPIASILKPVADTRKVILFLAYCPRTRFRPNPKMKPEAVENESSAENVANGVQECSTMI
jgi:hypothetical protein